MGRKRQVHGDEEGHATGKPPQANRDLGAVRGQKMGEHTGMGMTIDAGMRRGVQRRAAEDGGWRLRVVPRWAAL